jgi:hypothetical protein
MVIVETDETTGRPVGPRMIRREVWVDLPGDYTGFRARMWSNFPQRLYAEIASESQARIDAALHEIVLEHNGWCDQDGAPFPPADDPGFWDAVPTELALVVMVTIREASAQLPNSLLRAKRR